MPHPSEGAVEGVDGWLERKQRALEGPDWREARGALEAEVEGATPDTAQPLFENPFHLDDLLIFDDRTWRDLLAHGVSGVPPQELAVALRAGPHLVRRRVRGALPVHERAHFDAALRSPVAGEVMAQAQHTVLDAFFWELTYWKTPDLYEALTEGEQIHPGIFRQLAPELRGRVVLDAGAGSGRATLACLRAGASQVYAVEPSPGLLRLLDEKLRATPARGRVISRRGRFDALPLPDASVDVALSCSAFTAADEQGGEPGLAELRRVTRPGGLIVLIWPRPDDYHWLAAHGFAYVALPARDDWGVRFRSPQAALQVARRFYAHNRAVLRYLLRARQPQVPYPVLGHNPPHDYCWLRVE